LREGGLDRHQVTPDEIKTIEPTIRGEFVGGFFTPTDATGDIHKFTRELAAICERRGVRFLCDTIVDHVAASQKGITVHWREKKNGVKPIGEQAHASAIVICAGVTSPRFATMLGDRINLYPVKGYSITVNLDNADSQAAAPWVSLLDDEVKIVSSRLGTERFRVAGTPEFNGFNLDIRDVRVAPFVGWTRRLFPEISTEKVVPWTGLRPMTPNMLPRVGAGHRPGIFYNTGHGHLGWTLSAVTARIVAEAVGASLRAA
jgi:D-amino-acid dehydrogenase